MATLVKSKPKQKKNIEKNDKSKEGKLEIKGNISKSPAKVNFINDLEEILEDSTLEIPELEPSSVPIRESSAVCNETPRNAIDVKDKKETFECTNEKADWEENRRDSVIKNLNLATNAFKDVSEAAKNIKQDLSKLKLETVETKSVQLRHPQRETPTESYTFEEIAVAFGIKEIILARNYATEFKHSELQPVSGNHILFETLMLYKSARNHLLENTKSIKELQLQCQEKVDYLWMITHHKAKSIREPCPDKTYLSFEAPFQKALLVESEFSKYVNLASSLREKATEFHSTFSHNENLLQIQIDELLWRSTLNAETILDSLRIIFWVILTTGNGTDTHYNKQLINWCLSIGSELLKQKPSLKSTLFILHYLLSLNQNISWSYGLIQCRVSSISDIPAALSIFETILLSRRNMSHSTEAKTIPLDKRGSADDNTWLVVDFGDEVPDAELMVADGSTLRESDLLGLIGQIPFDQIFKEMMLVKDNSYELVFCGASSSPDLVLKIFCGARIAFSIIRHGLQLYDTYRILSSELCKLTQHYILYCTDLWEVTRSKCNISTMKRLSVEYDNLFRAGWSTIDCCAFKDITVMFQSLLPFKLIPETTLFGMFEEITKNYKAWTDNQIYHSLEMLSNMAIARQEYDFVLMVIKYLFSIGFTTENALKECGGIARVLCGSLLKHHPQHIGDILPEMTNVSKVAVTPKGEWLEVLPLLPWRPTSQQLINILNSWNLSCQDLLSFLIQGLDWNCRSGLPLNVHRDVAVFLAGLSQSFVRQKLPIPSWIFDCLILLRVHAVDWGYALETAPEPETLTGLELTDLLLGSSVSTSSRCHASAMVVLASTTWGHSLPLLYQKGVLLLIRLANAGRHREVVHLLYYAIAVLLQSPEDIKDSPGFKELLSTLLSSDRSYAQMATRFITGDVPGPITKLLTDLIKAQTAHYQSFMLQSPAPILSVWLQWLMSLDGWSSDFSVLYLADTVISCCFNDGLAMTTAFTFFKNYIENQTSSTSSSGLWTGNWFFGGGGPLKGMIQCPSAEVPLLWLVTMQAEHYVLEKTPGLWGRLLNKLSEQKEGKINVDKALKNVGGRDGSAGLTLYRAAQYAVTTPVTHPYHTILWQYFFSLYLDTNYLDYAQQLKPLGHLFFRGVVNSRLLSRLRSRLDDAKAHHESQYKRYSKLSMEITNEKEIQPNEISGSAGSRPDEYAQRAEFHKTQTVYMCNFKLWLDETGLQSIIDGHISSNSTDAMISKLYSLMHGQYYPWYETVDNFDSRRHSLQRWPTVLLEAKANVPHEEPPLPAVADDSSPTDRILSRLKDAVKEKTHKELKNVRMTQPIFLSGHSTSKEALTLGKSALDFIKNFDVLYSNSESALAGEDNLLLRHIKQLYKEKSITLSATKYCTVKTCSGVRLKLKYTESYIDLGVKEQINNNRIAFRAILKKLLVPFEELAKMTEVLIKVSQFPWALARDKLSPSETSAFFMNVLQASSTMSCLPLRDAASTAASKLGTALVSSSGPQCCALLIKCGEKFGEVGGLAYERRATIIGSMLRPLDLPTEEFIDVYKTIITSIPDSHITFSFLSKFDVAAWLKNHNPSPELTSEFLSLIIKKVAAAGAKPPAHYMIVQELLYVHLCRTLQWSWPVHLPEVLKEMSQLACDDQLPPATWEHVAKIIEANSHQIQLHCCTACGTVLGQSFQESRRRRLPCATWLGTAQSVHASSIARIGAGLGAAATAAAMLHQPTIMADRIAQLVFGILCSIFDPWLVPWWGESQALASGEPQVPWRPLDEKLVEIVFDAFVESLLYIVNTLPGSEVPLLRCVWSWYIWHFHRYNPNLHRQEWPTLPDHVIILTHQQLARLPWHMYSWMSLHEMESIVALSGRRNFNKLASHCMTGLRSSAGSWDWISGNPHYLGLVLVCLVTLELDQELLEDAAEHLPWWILNVDFLKEILVGFFSNLADSTEILCQHRLILLLCAASGLKATREAHDLQKKLALVQNWATFLERKSSKSLQNLGIDMRSLLEHIEAGSRTVSHDAEDDYISEGDLSICRVLFEVPVGLLNVESLKNHIVQEFIQFLEKCNRLSSRAIVGCIKKISNKDVYSSTSEAALDAYFRNGDDWDRLLNVGFSQSQTNLDYFIKQGSLLTAFVTLVHLQKDKRVLPVLLNKHALKSLKETAPSYKNEKAIIMWISLILTLLSSETLLNSFGSSTEAKAQLSAILKQWSEEKGWGLLKAIGLGQNTAPTQKFRVVMIYSQSIKLFILEGKPEMKYQLVNTGSQLCRTVKALEAMANQKGCAEVKETIVECLQWLKTVESYDEWKSHLRVLCENLYPDDINLYQYEM